MKTEGIKKLRKHIKVTKGKHTKRNLIEYDGDIGDNHKVYIFYPHVFCLPMTREKFIVNHIRWNFKICFAFRRITYF